MSKYGCFQVTTYPKLWIISDFDFFLLHHKTKFIDRMTFNNGIGIFIKRQSMNDDVWDVYERFVRSKDK